MKKYYWDSSAMINAAVSDAVAERLDAVSTRLGHSMDETTKQTVQRLQSLHERIAVIDHAQKVPTKN